MNPWEAKGLKPHERASEVARTYGTGTLAIREAIEAAERDAVERCIAVAEAVAQREHEKASELWERKDWDASNYRTTRETGALLVVDAIRTATRSASEGESNG